MKNQIPSLKGRLRIEGLGIACDDANVMKFSKGMDYCFFFMRCEERSVQIFVGSKFIHVYRQALHVKKGDIVSVKGEPVIDTFKDNKDQFKAIQRILAHECLIINYKPQTEVSNEKPA